MTDGPSTDPRANNPGVDYETTDVNTGAVFAFALGLLVTGIVIHLVVWMLFGFLAGREGQHAGQQYTAAAGQAQVGLPPSPRLQTNPREDLRKLREAEDAVLNGYGWVDRNNGIAHMPIDRAMKLTVERGLPTRGTQ